MVVMCAMMLAGPAWGKPKFFEAPPGKGVEDKYLVKLSDGITASKAPELIWDVGGGALLSTYKHLYNGFTARLTPGQAKVLSKNPLIEGVYQDMYGQPFKLCA